MLTHNVVASARPSSEADTGDRLDRRVQRSWWVFVGAFTALAALIAVRPLVGSGRVFDLVGLAVLILAGLAAVIHRQAVDDREQRRREEVEDVARILQGFSRAVSPDSVIEAILGELGRGTGADHLVVVRRRPDAPFLDATLVSARPGVPSSSAFLPAIDLEPDPAAGPEPGRVGVPVGPGPRLAPWGDEERAVAMPAAMRIAERVEQRIRRAFGLTHTLSAPIVGRDGILGVIVISRRRAGEWPDAARRLLEVASVEASAALARAYSHREAEAAAATDPLTGLPNRRYFEEFVALLGQGRRTDDAVGILMVDVDRFKVLNDRHGHVVGDVVLRAIGRTIAAAVRDIDVPARFGGEEFVVLLRNPSRAVALEVGERIRGAVERIDLRDVGVEKITVSVGASVADGAGQSVEDLVQQADRAMYRAKRFGRNRVETE